MVVSLITLTFLIALCGGMSIAFCFAVAGTIGIIALDPAILQLIPQRMYSGVNSFPLMAVPFFVLAGDLMGVSGILPRLIRFADALVGHVRGGLAQVNVVGSMVFAGISGSAVADASALGSTLVPMMRQRYGAEYATAICASAATIGAIIPPSVPMIMYAFVVGNVSIGALFLAGAVPGVLIGLGMMAIVYVTALRRGWKGTGRRASLREIISSSVTASWGLVMPAIILGGILGGVFTATEAGAVACLYAVFVGTCVTRELTWQRVSEAMTNCVLITGVVFLVLSTSMIVSFVLTASMAMHQLTDLIRGISTNPFVFLLIVNVVLFVMGILLDNIPVTVMLAPLLAPIAVSYGIDPVHFAIVFVLNSVIGLITPPVGAILFTVAGIAQVSIGTVSRRLVPYLMWLIVVLLLVTFIPSISLSLPKWAGLM